MKQAMLLATLILLSLGSAQAEESLMYKWSRVIFTATTAFAQVGQGQSERVRIGLVNREVNQSVHVANDPDNKWQSPAETLQTQSGDCEDIAILKMQALINIGIDKHRLTLLVVNDRFGNAHTVLQVDDMVLDNLTMTIVPLSQYPNRVIDRFRSN